MVSIIESGLTGNEGRVGLTAAVSHLSDLVSQDVYDSMLSQMGSEITCVDIVEWFKLHISGDIRNLSSPLGFQFDHMAFDFFHPAVSIFHPPQQIYRQIGDLIHKGQDTLRLMYPRVSSMIVADVAVPLFGAKIDDYPIIVGSMDFVRGVLQERYRTILNDEKLCLGPARIIPR